MAEGWFTDLNTQEGEEKSEEQKAPRTQPDVVTSHRGKDGEVTLEEKAAILYGVMMSFICTQYESARWQGPPPATYEEYYEILISLGVVIDEDAIEADIDDDRLNDLDFRIEQAREHIPKTYQDLIELMLEKFLEDSRNSSYDDRREIERIILENHLPATEDAFMKEILVALKLRENAKKQMLEDLGPLAALILGTAPKNP